MEKLVDLLSKYVHNEKARMHVLKYCEVNCGWLSTEFVAEESFECCLENFKDEHPEVALD